MKKIFKRLVFVFTLFVSINQVYSQITEQQENSIEDVEGLAVPIPIGPDDPIGPSDPFIYCDFTFQLKLNGSPFSGNVPAEGAILDLLVYKQGPCDLNIDGPTILPEDDIEPVDLNIIIGGGVGSTGGNTMSVTTTTGTIVRLGPSIEYEGYQEGAYVYKLTILPNNTGSTLDHSFILRSLPSINRVPNNNVIVRSTRDSNVILIQSASTNPTHGIFYIDMDEDGFGYGNRGLYFELTNVPHNYADNNLDQCPTEFGTGNGCPDAEGDLQFNYVRSGAYNRDGKLLGEIKTYYDDLGKRIQSQTYDISSKKIWVNETKYDSQGRPALQTLSAPVKFNSPAFNFEYQTDFIQKEGGTFTNEDFEHDSENPTMVTNIPNSLGWYYSRANEGEKFQDVTNRPYLRTIYSDLMPGLVKQTIGGNKINGEWKHGVSFTLPVAQEMYYTFGYEKFSKNQPIADTYENINSVINDSSNQMVWLKATKIIVEDVDGNESVVFFDTDGKTLGAAKSGWNNDSAVRTTAPAQYELLSLIGEQGFVDIHIPKGCENTLSFLGPDPHRVYKVYDLKTEEIVTTTYAIQNAGFYRIEYIGMKEYTKASNLTYISSDGSINAVEGNLAVGVRYKVNYYDYSLNEYNDIGQLTATLQPLGFNEECFSNTNKIKATVSHNEGLKSYFKYDISGQLIATESPDEGNAWFIYREDGQIRYSINSKQWEQGEFSYTEYDELGRPVESGVYEGNISNYLEAFPTVEITIEMNPFKEVLRNSVEYDEPTIPRGSNDRKEQHHTKYDFLNSTDVTYLNGVHTSYGNPSFLASNVAKTSNENSITYYSYDVYGRVQWIVQKMIGFYGGVKGVTIDYEYDPVTSQVLQVVFQKYNTAEKFIHRYTYDEHTQQLVKVETSTDGSRYTTHADYTYYETGALKRTTLADGIQDIDYVYNLAGQLKSINHPSLATDLDLNPNGTDLFGVTLDYYSGDYARDTNKFSYTSANEDQYNGNIKAMTWNTLIEGSETSPLQYFYEYDRNNWLTKATFDDLDNDIPETVVLDTPLIGSQTIKASNSIIFKDGFSIVASNTTRLSATINPTAGASLYANGDYNVSNLTYDANGNIKSLFRNKNTEKIGTEDSNRMDELSYEYYENKPNQLKRVDDAVTIDTHADDIKDQDGDNYEYNSIGQLIRNEEEKVDYEYNASGLVTLVKYNGKNKVAFQYNDKNFRTVKLTYENDGVSVEKRTDYLLDVAGKVLAIYENGIQKEFPIYGAGRLGIYNKATSTSVYQLTDHLGNVRAVIAKDETGNAAAITSATDYYPFGMAMTNRKWGANGYRYGYQGEFAETDVETLKPSFQLRIYEPRIGRWLTPDPYGQYHSPYMAMDNTPNQSVDPDGGCTDKDGNECEKPENGGVVYDGGGNPWSYSEGAWNTEFDFGLSEVIITGRTSEVARIMSDPSWLLINGPGSARRSMDGALVGIAALMAAPIVLPGIMAIGSFVPSVGTTVSSLVSRNGLATLYDLGSEIYANDFHFERVNILGVGLTLIGVKGIAGELINSGVDITWEKGLEIKTLEQTMLSLHAGRLNSKLAYKGRIGGGYFFSALTQSYVKKLEDQINQNLLKESFFSIHELKNSNFNYIKINGGKPLKE
ncbi:RHS repeat domain-containing protein [Tenacibaculum sp. M341]|uniref:RHS repeat domain-containing protein n=1 Tax=Tenacibaculum sp. M341 TaxID=2530339 RepID=UPI001053D45A|nr:RHS repeat-associated core domain-containing protein [Tenacibaculum sp. M341]TCI90296.1 hypothetical protein EYW44_13755 [Tenacibaculum sp. M341]